LTPRASSCRASATIRSTGFERCFPLISGIAQNEQV
jgi:hypothetical protein